MLTVMIFHISHKQNEHIMRLAFIRIPAQPWRLRTIFRKKKMFANILHANEDEVDTGKENSRQTNDFDFGIHISQSLMRRRRRQQRWCRTPYHTCFGARYRRAVANEFHSLVYFSTFHSWFLDRQVKKNLLLCQSLATNLFGGGKFIQIFAYNKSLSFTLKMKKNGSIRKFGVDAAKQNTGGMVAVSSGTAIRR